VGEGWKGRAASLARDGPLGSGGGGVLLPMRSMAMFGRSIPARCKSSLSSPLVARRQWMLLMADFAVLFSTSRQFDKAVKVRF
jgi:hypothetical protein